MKKLGIIAGSGQLPLLIINECKKQSIEPIVILIKDFADPNDFKGLKQISIGFGKVGKVIGFLKKNNVEQIVFAGAVKKPELRHIIPDFTGLFLLFRLLGLKLFGDNSVLKIVIDFAEEKGFEVVPVDNILKDAKVKEGIVGVVKPNKKEYENDINLGIDVLKKLSKYDIGQSIVIQNGMVLGIEGPEGTKELIKRCGRLKQNDRRKPILIKIKKLNQTRKADLPSIGEDTIQQLIDAGFSGLAVDADNTLVIEKFKMIKLADKNNIFIIGVKS